MAKVQPHIDFGAGYVQLSRLPFDQAIEIKSWIPMTAIVNLSTAQGKIKDAVQYSQYEYWFDFHYTQNEDFDYEF